MSSSPALLAEDLVKDYGGVRALDGFSVEVDRGEFFGLLGPNGAGKTTFIETLVGLAEPTDGTAAVFGHDVIDDRAAVRDRIGLAPQEYNVDRFFPIQEVLEHKAGYHGFSRARASERAATALERVGLSERADATFKSLSGGMKRRVILARALVTDPDLLILDEPTAGVDVSLRRDIWDVVRGLNDDGTTVLLTTHYIEEAERLCDRVCILDDGQTVEVNTPEELRRRGTDTYRVRVADPPARAAPLRALEEVLSVSPTDEGLSVRARRSSGALPVVITTLADAGVEVTDVDIERANLEDAFVDMTRNGDEGTAGGGDDGGRGDADEDVATTTDDAGERAAGASR
ncbi:MAG: ATP-binding cassette domain-containing protein [Halolamina sp.]